VMSLVVGKHIVEGVVELIRTLLDLQLLPVDLVLDVVNPLVKLGDVHLSVLEPGLGDLVLVLQGEDLLHQLNQRSKKNDCEAFSSVSSNLPSAHFTKHSSQWKKEEGEKTQT